MIDQFLGEYRFLSNFFLCPVYTDGEYYPSSEHAYQAAKTNDPHWKEAILWKDKSEFVYNTPGKAKKLGRMAPLRPDWEEVKLQVMERILRRKFTNPNLRARLVATKDHYLLEGNNWGDTFWGVCDGSGKNHLGKLLMKIRQELIDGTFDVG